MRDNDSLTPEEVNALSPGSRVAWSSGSAYDGPHFGFGVVTRLTRTQIVIKSDNHGNEVRARRADNVRDAGQIVGQSGNCLLRLDSPSLRDFLIRVRVAEFRDRMDKAVKPMDPAGKWNLGPRPTRITADNVMDMIAAAKAEIQIIRDKIRPILDGTDPRLRPTESSLTPGSHY